MKSFKTKLLDKSGSALAMTIMVFAIVAIMSACLVVVVNQSQKMDLKTYRQEQAYVYAQAGLSMAFEYIETKAGESDGSNFIENDLMGREFEGTISNMTFNDPTSTDNPNDMPGFKIKCTSKMDGTEQILVVTSTATYQGVSASATRYMYAGSAQDDDDAIDSLGDITIQGSPKDVYGNDIYGDLKGRNITINGYSEFANIAALGELTNINMYGTSSTVVVNNVNAYNNITLAGGSTIKGSVQSVGGVKLYQLGTCPKSIVAWGQSGDVSGYGVDISLASVGDPANVDAQNVVLYSGKDARIDSNAHTQLYGTVIVDGDLYLDGSSQINVFGNLLVKGSIIGNEGNIIVSGTKALNYTDEEVFKTEAENYSVVSVNAISKKIGYPREIPVTIFPNVCNSPTIHPQRTTAGGWSTRFVENSADFAQRQAEYKEINLADPNNRNYINNKGGTSVDDGTEKLVTFYEDYNSRGLFININESGKYVNIQELINQTSPNPNSIILYLDASGKDLDICLDSKWDFGMSNWGQLKSQIIVNDGGGAHTVRFFLEKNTELNMGGATQCVGLYNGTASTLYSYVRSGQDVSSLTDMMNTSIPRLFVFSDGALAADGDIDMTVAPKVKVSTDLGNHPNGGLFRGYIYAPYAYVAIDSTNGPVPCVGKVEVGDILTGGNAVSAIYYNKPEANEYSSAIAGVYYPPNSSGGGGSGSVYSKYPKNRDKF